MISVALIFSCLFWAIAEVAGDSTLTNVYEAYNTGEYGPNPNQTYVSSNIKGPQFHIHHWDKSRTGLSRFLFMTPPIFGQKSGPWIFSAEDLSLIYANPHWEGGNDCNVQFYNDKPYISFWSGHDFKGLGDGYGILLDENYQVAYNITTKNLPTGGDSHEFLLTHDGGAILNNFHTIVIDARSFGGPEDAKLSTCSFQEIDIATGNLRFSWNAIDHFDINERFNGDWDASPEHGFDWFHMNSISKTKAGDYLISSRHLCMIALISGKDGKKIWQIGGKNNLFRDLSDGKATNFAFQHHARFINEEETEMTLYDNRAWYATAPTPGCDHDCSRGMHIRIDTQAMTAQLLREIYHPASIQAWAEGGYQHLPNGNALVSWGNTGGFSEVLPDGQVIFDVQNGPWFNVADGGKTQIYRVFTGDWVGHPAWPPAIAALDGHVYVSWNGATELASWKLYAGMSTAKFEFRDELPRQGFETKFNVPEQTAFMKADALDKDGNILGSTDIIKVDGEVTGERAAFQKPLPIRLPKHR